MGITLKISYFVVYEQMIVWLVFKTLYVAVKNRWPFR